MAEDPEVGSIFASREADGTFAILKVLAVDDAAIHLRSYANRYERLPAEVPEGLTLGMGLKAILDARLRGEDASGIKPTFGIGHFPLSRAAFATSDFVLLGRQPVEDAELEGHRTWQSTPDGGVFG